MELRIVLGSSSRRTRRPGAGRDPSEITSGTAITELGPGLRRGDEIEERP